MNGIFRSTNGTKRSMKIETRFTLSVINMQKSVQSSKYIYTGYGSILNNSLLKRMSTCSHFIDEQSRFTSL